MSVEDNHKFYNDPNLFENIIKSNEDDLNEKEYQFA